jgi:hypothetical protein
MSTDKKSFFVDAKRVIGMQCNGQSKKEKNDKQWSKKKLHRKLKIEQHESHLKPGRNSVGDNLSL